MKCRISRSLLARIASETRAFPGIESCGLLLGTAGWIGDAAAVPNVAPDPSGSFAMDPEACLHASRPARAAGLRVVGHYHYHPSGSTAPSAADAAGAAQLGVYWLILTSRGHGLWISSPGGAIAGAFDAAALAIVDAPPCKVPVRRPIGRPNGTAAPQGRSGA